MNVDDLMDSWVWFWPIVNEGAMRFGGSIVSGIRSEDRNEMVGGHPESRHVVGLAADIEFLPDTDGNASRRCWLCFDWLKTHGLRGYVRQSGTSLHIQDRSASAPT